MGLQLDINYKGLVILNGYVKVVHMTGNKNNMYFNVEYYTNKETADADIKNENFLSVSPMYSMVPDLNSELNLWQQCYEYLKTLPEFNGTINV